MGVQRQAFIRWILLVLPILWLGIAHAQEKPAAGVKLDLEQLDLLLRGGLPNQVTPAVEEIFNNTRGQIVRGIRDAVADFDKPMNFKDSKRVNVTRELLMKPILQKAQLDEIKSRRIEWMASVENFYRGPDLNLEEAVIQTELQDWSDFFQKLEARASDEEMQKIADEFFEVGLTKTLKRSDLPVENLPLFLRQRDDWLRALRSAYSKDADPAELGWVDDSIKNWSLIFDEMMDWELSVTYDIDFHPEVEGLEVGYEFPPEGNLANAKASVQMDPLLHIRSISIFLQNQTTGETISLGIPENYEQKWKLSDKLKGSTDIGFQLDLKRENPVSVDVGAAKTNIIPTSESKGILIRQSDVDAFMKDLLTPERAQLVLAQLRPSSRSENVDFQDLQSFEKVQTQLESDVKNFLGQKDLEVAAVILQTPDGHLQTQVMILSESRGAEIQALYEQSRDANSPKVVADFRAKIPLDIDQASLDFDVLNQMILANFDLPSQQNLKWRLEQFKLPSALFKDVKNPLAQTLIQKFQETNFNTKDLEIETDLDFPDLVRNQSDLQIRLPLIWQAENENSSKHPQIDLERVSVEAPGVANARISNVRFRADQETKWVNLDFKSQTSLSDQIYNQLYTFVENIKAVVGKEGFETLQRELAAYLKQIALAAKISLAPPPGQKPGASGIVAGVLGIEEFDLAPDAIDIDWSVSQGLIDSIELVQSLNRDSRAEGLSSGDKNSEELVSGFDSLPKIYQIFKEQPALHRMRTSIQLPNTIRIRVDDFENTEAKVKYMEFSLSAPDLPPPKLTIYWKFVQDGSGRLLMLPELHNLKNLLSYYKPVMAEGSEVEGPHIGAIHPLNPWAKGADVGSMALGAVGGAVGGAVSSVKPSGISGWIGKWTAKGVGSAAKAANSEISDFKIETLKSKIEKKFEEKDFIDIDELLLKIVDKVNGFQLQDLEVEQVSFRSRDLARVVGNEGRPTTINNSAPLRALQNQFEKILKTQVAEFRLKERLGQIFVENQNLVDKSVDKIKGLVTDTLLGSGPFPSWPERFTNLGLARTWNELEDKASAKVAELPQSSIEGILGNPNAKNGEVSGVNQKLQTEVKTKVEEKLNEPFQKIRLPIDDDPNPDSKFDLLLPNVVCFDSPEDPLASISLWYEEKDSSFVSEAPRPALDRLAQDFINAKKRMGEPMDALVWMSLEDIQKKMIEPNLQNARELLNEEILKNMPGTEVILGNVELKVEKSPQGHQQVFAYTELRLKQKAGFIKFDSGRDFVSVRIPLQIHASNADRRPEKPGDELPVGYNIQIYPDYPIQVLDPNSGNIVDHWLKKYIAYPKLAEAIVYEEYQGNNPRVAKQQRRVQEIPIPVDVGLPKADQLVRLNIDPPQFVKDENGEAYVFIPTNYRLESRQDLTQGENLELQVDSSSFESILQNMLLIQMNQPDFVFRRLFENLLKDSDTKDWAFSRNQALKIDFNPLNLDSMIEESAEHPGQFIFRARSSFFQESGQERILILEGTEVEIPFEYMQVKDGDEVFYVIDPEAVRFRTLGNKNNLNEVSQEFLEYLEEVDPRPLRFDPISR